MTERQQQLLDWMRDPKTPTQPQIGIIWKDALWPVSALVAFSGIEGYTYGKCRRDLEALRKQNLVNEIVPGRWREGALS